VENIKFTIKFENVSVAQGNKWARDLRDTLTQITPDVQAEARRDNNETMDLGPFLEVILGTSALKAVGKGIQAWLARKPGASIELSKGGAVKATGLKGSEVLALAELLQDGKHVSS